MLSRTAFVVVLAACAAGSTPVLAQDARAQDAVAQNAGAHHWSGFYIGGHAGGGEGRLEGTTQDLRGALAGGHVGYNWQFANVVAGLEADLSWSDYELSIREKIGGFQFGASTSSDFLTSLRGRLGFADGPIMIYGTAGIAYTEVDTSLALTGPGVNSVEVQTTDISGVIGGIGLEYAVNHNISLRGEALWFDLHQDFDFSKPGYSGNVFRGGFSYSFK